MSNNPPRDLTYKMNILVVGTPVIKTQNTCLQNNNSGYFKNLN